jgi:ATP-dependent helicase YprA (DUF1998 family)
MRPTDELYRHQRTALEKVLLEGKDIVVTTGTGSGKTECFLLPLLGQLARESQDWPESPKPPHGHEWWKGEDEQVQRVGQWDHTGRAKQGLHALRAIILYPLNALVEDQLRRLRATLDSDFAHRWFNEHRRGNRILYGRYTGLTPVSGREERWDAEKGKYVTNKAALERLQLRLQEVAGESADVLDAVKKGEVDEEVRYYFQNIAGGEMWSRWDMQETPPDILITNYSMLNIMLMRGIEARMFHKTKKWLVGDPDRATQPRRKFFLIIDELHAYRGTPGTEVAYILRLLLQRLGLGPDSKQLQILTTSASVEAGEKSSKFLRDFFGRDAFEIIDVKQKQPEPGSRYFLKGHHKALAKFAANLQPNVFKPMVPPDPESDSTNQAMRALAAALGRPAKSGEPVEETLAQSLKQCKAPEALRDAAAALNDNTVRPTKAPRLDRELFPEPYALMARAARTLSAGCC